MWTPLSRTPICLDTVCCRLDNRNISLGETGTTNLWKCRERAVPVARRVRTVHRVTSPSRIVPRVGGWLWGILHTASRWMLVTWAMHNLYLLSHAWAGEDSALPLLFIQGYNKILCSWRGKKKLIPSILFPIELNRFLVKSLFLWVIDLTVWAN